MGEVVPHDIVEDDQTAVIYETHDGEEVFIQSMPV